MTSEREKEIRNRSLVATDIHNPVYRMLKRDILDLLEEIDLTRSMLKHSDLNYLSAVKGRQDFLEAYKLEREKNESLKSLLLACQAEFLEYSDENARVLRLVDKIEEVLGEP